MAPPGTEAQHRTTVAVALLVRAMAAPHECININLYGKGFQRLSNGGACFKRFKGVRLLEKRLRGGAFFKESDPLARPRWGGATSSLSRPERLHLVEGQTARRQRGLGDRVVD